MQKFNYVRQRGVETILEFLTRRFAYKTRDKWVESIVSGAILINSEVVNPERILNNKDIISYTRNPSDEPEIDRKYKLLYEDDQILVVDKSGNIPISESGKYYKNTLLNLLKEKEGYKELYAVHRLDRETSGIVLIARTKDIATLIGKQFQFQKPKKEYHAVLVGEFKQKQFLVEAPIKQASLADSTIKIRQIVDQKGKSSKTEFVKVKVMDGLTLARIKLFTGRTHQIRCHAEYLGYPVLGDKLYGQQDAFFIAVMNGEKEASFGKFGVLNRHLLHASKLSFSHPKHKRRMNFYSSYETCFSEYKIVENLISA